MNELIVGASVAIVAGFIGFGARVFESVRNERRETYLQYIRSVDKIPISILDMVSDPLGDEDLERTVGEEVAMREQELGLIGSRRVVRAADAHRKAIVAASALTRDLFKRMQKDEVAGQQFLQRYSALVAPTRNRLLNAMRRDLNVRRLKLSV